jgi:hypothetical protein
MKKLALMTVAVLITTFAFAQKVKEKEVPTSVKTAFQNNFPQAKVEQWEKEGVNFEAEFELNNSEQSVVFDDQGNLLETEIEIGISQLPKGVLEYVKANYQGQNIKEVAKITDAKGTVTYESEIKGMDLLFDSTGKFIKEIKN